MTRCPGYGPGRVARDRGTESDSQSQPACMPALHGRLHSASVISKRRGPLREEGRARGLRPGARAHQLPRRVHQRTRAGRTAPTCRPCRRSPVYPQRSPLAVSSLSRYHVVSTASPSGLSTTTNWSRALISFSAALNCRAGCRSGRPRCAPATEPATPEAVGSPRPGVQTLAAPILPLKPARDRET